MITTKELYMWSFMTQIFRNDLPSLGGDRKTFEVMTSVQPLGTFGSVATLLAANIYQRNHEKNHKLWNILSAGRYTPYAGAAGMLLHINGKSTNGKFK